VERAAYFIAPPYHVKSKYVSDFRVEFCCRFNYTRSVIQHKVPSMPILKRITRFGGFPALRIGQFYAVWFNARKFGLHRPRAVESRNGVCNITAINLGRLMVMREVPLSACHRSSTST
jgi:hypothetical protein